MTEIWERKNSEGSNIVRPTVYICRERSLLKEWRDF